MKRLLAITFALCLMLTGLCCAEELREMDVVLDWYPNALHAFMYVAIEKGYYAEDKEGALEIALGLINEGATVTMGGGMSVHEIGLVEALKKGNYNFIDRDELEDREAGTR